jgi:antitoxin component YwqK of YwqJK toxin-antitoxin module
MRKTAVLLALLLSMSVLSAQVYRSNVLGQKLDAIGSVPAVGYAIDETVHGSVMYLDGKIVRVTERVTTGNTTVETERDMATGKEKTRTYTDGLLVSETDADGSGTVYAYVEGHLAFSSRTAADGEVLMTFFLRSAGDGKLMAVREGESIRFVNDSYIFQNDDLLQQLAADLVVGSAYEILDNGNIRYEENGIIYTYSPSGKLLMKEENGAVSEYFYSDNKVSRVETVSGSMKSIELYEDGKAVGITVYENGVIASKTMYRAEGNIQTLYRDGRVVATVYYRQDNRTVDSIEYNQ